MRIDFVRTYVGTMYITLTPHQYLYLYDINTYV